MKNYNEDTSHSKNKYVANLRNWQLALRTYVIAPARLGRELSRFRESNDNLSMHGILLRPGRTSRYRIWIPDLPAGHVRAPPVGLRPEG